MYKPGNKVTYHRNLGSQLVGKKTAFFMKWVSIYLNLTLLRLLEAVPSGYAHRLNANIIFYPSKHSTLILYDLSSTVIF